MRVREVKVVVVGGNGREAAEALDCVSPIIFHSRCLSSSSSPFRGKKKNKKEKKESVVVDHQDRARGVRAVAAVFKVRRLDAPDKERPRKEINKAGTLSVTERKASPSTPRTNSKWVTDRLTPPLTPAIY